MKHSFDRDQIQPLRITETSHRLNPSNTQYEIVIRENTSSDSNEGAVLLRSKLLKTHDRDELSFVAATVNEAMQLAMRRRAARPRTASDLHESESR